MAKAASKAADTAAVETAEVTTPPPPPEPTTTYRDKVYTSRTLILPDGRSLAVAKGRVTVTQADTVAVEFLGEHADLEVVAE